VLIKDEALRLAISYLAASGSDLVLDEAAAYLGEPPSAVYRPNSKACWVLPLQRSSSSNYVGAANALIVWPATSEVEWVSWGE
jgi:hypothetical protein